MSATAHTVNVSGIDPATTKEHLNDFFTFCGKITSIDYDTQAKSAVIHFEKASAAKTALMLNGGTLDGATLSVTSDSVSGTEEEHHDAAHDGPIDQSDKPRAGIAAEYLAKGYSLSDQILHRAIEIDNKQGISKRFLSYIQSIDHTLGSKALGPEQTISGKVQETVGSATQQAKSLDEQRGFSKTATSYYERAIQSPFGQKVLSFYTSTSKQIQDIHEEALRLKNEHKPAAPAASEQPAPAGTSTEPPAPTTQAAPTVV